MIYFYYREIQFNETNLIVTDRDTTLMNVVAIVRAKCIRDCRTKSNDVKVDRKDKEIKDVKSIESVDNIMKVWDNVVFYLSSTTRRKV